jgi:hypothetical protein
VAATEATYDVLCSECKALRSRFQRSKGGSGQQPDFSHEMKAAMLSCPVPEESEGCAAASCLGRYQIEVQPSVRHRTHRCPKLRDALASADGQSQGIQPTLE